MEDNKSKTNVSTKEQTENGSGAPWEPPIEEEKQAAESVKKVLKEALRDIDSQEKADEVAAEIETATRTEKVEDVQDNTEAPESVEEAAKKVEEAAEAAPSERETTKEALTETAKQVVATEGREQEVLSEAVQEAVSPEAQETEEEARESELLRDAILRRMAPLDALDARLFIAINHLPHTFFLNRFFYFLTHIFNGGGAWYFLISLIWLLNRRLGKRVAQNITLPLTLSTMVVEFPIKSYFRRKRPFIKIVQAIVIGKKPGTWSFPSGHSASAFAGAWLFQRQFPKQGGLFYLLAALVAFSRIFLGNHYPGDVIAGSLAGHFLARFFKRLQPMIEKKE